MLPKLTFLQMERMAFLTLIGKELHPKELP